MIRHQAAPAASIAPISHAEAVDYLSGLFGQVVTAAIAGVDDARFVEAWSAGLPIGVAERRRLDGAYRAAKHLRESLSEQSVRAWFLGMNPDLDDRSPVEALQDDAERVVQAADDFVAHG